MFKVSLVRCLLFGAMSMIAGQLPNIYYLAIGRPRQSFGGSDPVWWLLYVVGALGSIAISAALCLHQRDIVTGVPTKAVAKLWEAARRLPAILGVTLLVMLIAVASVGFSRRSSWWVPTAWTMRPRVSELASCSFMSRSSACSSCSPGRRCCSNVCPPLAALRYSFSLVFGNWWRTAAVLQSRSSSCSSSISSWRRP